MKTQNIISLAKRNHSFGIFNIRKLSVSNNKQKPTNRWHLSAEGFLLLPSALRPHLLDKKLVKNTQFWAILALFQIVAASTIFGSLCSTPVSAASLTLTIPSSFSLDIIPGANGVFSKSSEQTINVKTDNSSGYTLSIKAKNSDNSNSLINSNINNKLNSITESTTEDLFKSDSKFNNTWGYMPSKFNNEDNTNFLPGPTTEESILETTEEANEAGADYNITIGAKVDNTISSGSYNNDFVFSVMVNEPKYDAIIQNWTGCADLPDDGNTVVNLLDIRDNNVYKVGKLKDGKCWMLQNLRIIDKEISYIDSDMTEEAGTFKIPESNISKFLSEDNNNDAAWYNIESTTKEEDGSYYTWYTATAGSGTADISSGEAANSICPKGWRLPRGGRQGVSSNELATLLKAYGGDEFTHNDGQQAIINKLVSPAFPNFTYAGYIGYNSGSLTYYGTGARYWTSTAYSSTNAHGLLYDIDSGALSPNNQTEKRSGRSVRCVADTGPRVTITYHLNSGTGGPTSPSTQHSDNSRITLDAAVPTRDEYGFVGWCDQYTTSSSCPGKLTRPDKTYEINGQTDLNFYAVWKLYSEVSDKGFLGTMQDFDCDANLPEINDYGTVTDSRDNNEYKVARLFDGKCWMTQNLRLINKTITSTDSDIISGTYTIPASTSSGWNNHVYTNNLAYYGNNTNYGAQYTWLTATAGTGTASLSSGEAPSSICPKGWRLPTKAEMKTLTSAYSASQAQTTPANFGSSSWAGYCDQGGCTYDQGSYGRWWSSAAYSGDYAYRLYSYSGNFNAGYGYKGGGFSVRCVGRE